jgi:cytochrome c553
MFRNFLAAVLCLPLALALTAGAAAGDVDAGKEKSAQCAACHGPEGIAIAPNFPNLAGQYRSYLQQALRQYRGGQRNNAVMAAFAVNLSDEDIDDLAAYYAAQSGLAILPSD